jgi:hypothetical protein
LPASQNPNFTDGEGWKKLSGAIIFVPKLDATNKSYLILKSILSIVSSCLPKPRACPGQARRRPRLRLGTRSEIDFGLFEDITFEKTICPSGIARLGGIDPGMKMRYFLFDFIQKV